MGGVLVASVWIWPDFQASRAVVNISRARAGFCPGRMPKSPVHPDRRTRIPQAIPIVHFRMKGSTLIGIAANNFGTGNGSNGAPDHAIDIFRDESDGSI